MSQMSKRGGQEKNSLVRLTTFVLQVMPKLHLAYLVEDVEYPRPEELQASNEVKYLLALSSPSEIGQILGAAAFKQGEASELSSGSQQPRC